MPGTDDAGAAQQAGGQPKQERARRTKAQILRAAAEIFAEHGYAAVTLQDVAARASMTKGAVYFHFANKQVLALAVVEEHYRRWPPLLERVRALGLSPLESLLAVLDGTAEAFRHDTVVQAGARLQIERSLIDADLPQPYVWWPEVLAELIAKARDAGQLRPETTPESLARVFVSAFFGMQHTSDVLTGRADLMDRYVEMRDALLKGFVVG
ncbi:ScbR family autoregulator-binding transcription factor [Streptomyces sp. enrichment culture]|uniref:ScbR family autoregulator-binding transcription factor n=1 Tax=Streptomyces sp. enrichment culture TaxID=1795815 RepID=UPI003F5728A1